MSEYQLLKARALAAQQEREREMQYEIEAKAARLKAQRKEEEERRKRQEAASKEARTLELKRANEAINAGKSNDKKEEYDPFAEVERPVASTSYKPNKSVPSRTVRAIHSSSREDIPRPPAIIPKSKKATTTTTTTKGKDKESSPPALGRKEKAARALLESAKRGKATSIFSVKSNNPSLLPPQRIPSMSSTGKGKGKGKEVGHTDLRALCPDRGSRDNRSIDQIQRDIKARKLNPGVKEGKRSRSPDKKSNPPSTSRPPIRPAASSSSRRRPSPTPSTSTSSEDEAPRKRVKPNDERTKVSAMIQELFRRPGGQGGQRKAVYSDSESDDMEAGLSDVEEEEQRAIRIARREDELAEREERERKARKEKLRREREGR